MDGIISIDEDKSNQTGHTITALVLGKTLVQNTLLVLFL